jgi:NTE family protein
MAISNISNNSIDRADYQNHNVANTESHAAAPSPQKSESSAVHSANPAKPASSPAAHSSLSSMLVKSQLAAKLVDRPSSAAVSRKNQQPIANLLHFAARLENNSNKYGDKINAQIDGVKNSAAELLDAARTARQQLSSIRAGQDSKQSAEINSLIKQLDATIKTVQGSTKDLFYNTDRHLNNLSQGVTSFHNAARSLAQGNGQALKSAQTAINQIGDASQQLSRQAANFASKTAPSVTQLHNALSLGGVLGSIKNLPGDVAGVAKGAAGDIAGVAKGVAGEVNNLNPLPKLADKLYNFKYNTEQTVNGYIDEYVQPLLKALKSGLSNLIGSVLHPDHTTNGKSIPVSKLVSDTADLRATIAAAKAGDQNAIAKLKSQYGYTLQTAPKPGQMWLAANHIAGNLDNGKIDANQFPGSSNVNTQPANLNNFPFGVKKSITLRDASGKETVVTSMQQYEQIVAANRAKAGMPVQGGKPIPIQLTLEGGGGKGKRYAPSLEEMYNLGIIPASVSGTSAGAITASLIAAGMDPGQADSLEKDPALNNLFDAKIGGPGILQGRALYNYMDQKLREITGIKDRPVTFADLPMPLYLTATKLSDSQAPNSMTSAKDREFIFSKETTPDTPVAMALVASASVPGAFDPMDFVDPSTGRTIRLVDGGVLNNLPVGLQHNNLPEVALQLDEPGSNNQSPDDVGNPQPLPAGNLNGDDPIDNAKIGLKLLHANDTDAQDHHKALDPAPGVFALSIPTWNLNNVSQTDSTFGFGYNKGVDPTLDSQTFQTTDNFFRQFMGKLNQPGASGTNLTPPPGDTDFTRSFNYKGESWTATHQAGSNDIDFVAANGEKHQIDLGKNNITSWINDDASFHDLPNRLSFLLNDYENFVNKFKL